MNFLLVLVTLTTFGQLPHLDSNFDCISADQAQRYVSDFRIHARSFGGVELCDNSADAKLLFNDLRLIEEGRFKRFDDATASGPAGSDFDREDGGFVPDDKYYEWMKRQTRGVRRDRSFSYATAYNSGGYFTMLDGWAKLSTLGRVGTIIHEARHSQGYRHIPCVNGPYNRSSMRGCDADLAEGGSHGVEMEYYARVVLRGENFHPVYQSMARLMLLARSNFVFNRKPVQERKGLLFVENNQVVLTNGQKSFRRMAPTVGESVVKTTSYGAALFDRNTMQTRALDLYGTKQGAAVMKDVYSYFKLLEQPHLREGLVDLEEIDLEGTRWLIAYNQRSEILSYNFARGEWYAPVVAPETIARMVRVNRDGVRGAYLILTSGKVWQYDPLRRQGEMLAGVWDARVKNYVRFDAKTWALGVDGKVYEVVQGSSGGVEGVAESWLVPVPGMRDRRVSQMTVVPVYDVFSIEE